MVLLYATLLQAATTTRAEKDRQVHLRVKKKYKTRTQKLSYQSERSNLPNTPLFPPLFHPTTTANRLSFTVLSSGCFR